MTKKFTGHVEIVGRGMPILCIPGFGNANWIFERLVTPLQDSFQFILPDHRGMGGTPAATAPYRLDDLTGDLLDLLDDLELSRVGVIGLSMGGFIAQLLALRAPERIGPLVLLCTTSGGEAFRRIFPSMSEGQVRAIYLMEAKSRIHAAFSPFICPVLQPRYPELFNYLLEMRLRHPENPEEVFRQFSAVNSFMQNELDLGAIRSPTLILSGDNDPLVPLANAQLLQQKIPGAEMAVIEGTDHLFFLEKATEVGMKIREFLQR